MSDVETGAVAAPTRRLFGGAPPDQATPIFSAGPVHSEILPDEQADYADVKPDTAAMVEAMEVVNAVVGQPVAEPETADTVSAIEEPVAETKVEAMPLTNLELDRLSVEELKRQQEEIQRTLDEKTRAEKQEVISQVVNVVRTYNITTEELVEALGGFKVKRKGVKATMKYRDPESGAEWSGRGKEPVWLRGRDRNQFLIQAS